MFFWFGNFLSFWTFSLLTLFKMYRKLRKVQRRLCKLSGQKKIVCFPSKVEFIGRNRSFSLFKFHCFIVLFHCFNLFMKHVKLIFLILLYLTHFLLNPKAAVFRWSKNNAALKSYKNSSRSPRCHLFALKPHLMWASFQIFF